MSKETELKERLLGYIEDEVMLEAVGIVANSNPSLVNKEQDEKERTLNPEGDAVLVDYEGRRVYIPREELEWRPVTGSLIRFIGEPIAFKVIRYDEEEDMFIGSAKEINELLRDKLADEMTDGKPREAVVQTLLRFGAYVTIDGHSTLLRNQDFSTDYTAVQDVLNVGDTIEVELVEYTEDKNLNIQAVEKYRNKNIAMAIEDLEEGQPVLGTVQDITFLKEGHAVFTRIAPGLDAISPTPENIDVNVGDKVIFMLTQLNYEEGRVRGYIIRKSHSDI